jgi:hypothetical protein
LQKDAEVKREQKARERREIEREKDGQREREKAGGGKGVEERLWAKREGAGKA